MKKITAVFLVFILTLLSSCSSGSETVAETPSDAPTIPPTTETEYITSWGTNLVPDDFPAPPATMTMYSYSLDDHEEGIYSDGAQVLTLTFNCTKPDFLLFSNSLKEAGYKGGIHQPSDNNKVHGGWQNGETIVLISGCVNLGNHEYTYILELSENTSAFPSGLKSLFPEFDGCSINSGNYTYKDVNGNYQFDDIPKDFNENIWMLTHLPSEKNVFVGVTEAEFKDYYKELTNWGFEGALNYMTNDGANIITFDSVKQDENGFLIISLLYNIPAQTLSTVYSNDYSYYY